MRYDSLNFENFTGLKWGPPCVVRLILSAVLSRRRYNLSCRLDVLSDKR